MKSWLLQQPRSRRVLLCLSLCLCSSESGSLASGVMCCTRCPTKPLSAAPERAASLCQNAALQNGIYLPRCLVCVMQAFTWELTMPDSMYYQRGAAGAQEAQLSSAECKFLSYAKSVYFSHLKWYPKVTESQMDTYCLNIYICSMNSTHVTGITPMQTVCWRFLCCFQALPSCNMYLGLRWISWNSFICAPAGTRGCSVYLVVGSSLTCHHSSALCWQPCLISPLQPDLGAEEWLSVRKEGWGSPQNGKEKGWQREGSNAVWEKGQDTVHAE